MPSFIWTSYNKPTQIGVGSATYTFDYGPDRKRYRKTIDQDTTYYIGNSFERINRASSTEYRHVIRANGRAIMLRKTVGAGVSHQYIHRDHLGSITALTDEATGAVLQRFSYDAWGKRRSATDWTSAAAPTTEHRGYTGHEHLDKVGLIHMNGRIYSPDIARMLSPDPVTQAPENGQNYNRYTYAFNNPLKYTDPSGYEAGTAFIVRSIVSSVFYKIGGLFGGGCDSKCQFTREIHAWCNATDCLAPSDPIERLRAGEDLAYVGNTGNQMSVVQAWMIDQSRIARGDNTSREDPITPIAVVDYDLYSPEILQAIDRAATFMGSKIKGYSYEFIQDDKLLARDASIPIAHFDPSRKAIVYSGAALEYYGFSTVDDVAGVFVHELEHMYQGGGAQATQTS